MTSFVVRCCCWSVYACQACTVHVVVVVHSMTLFWTYVVTYILGGQLTIIANCAHYIVDLRFCSSCTLTITLPYTFDTPPFCPRCTFTTFPTRIHADTITFVVCRFVVVRLWCAVRCCYIHCCALRHCSLHCPHLRRRLLLIYQVLMPTFVHFPDALVTPVYTPLLLPHYYYITYIVGSFRTTTAFDFALIFFWYVAVRLVLVPTRYHHLFITCLQGLRWWWFYYACWSVCWIPSRWTLVLPVLRRRYLDTWYDLPWTIHVITTWDPVIDFLVCSVAFSLRCIRCVHCRFYILAFLSLFGFILLPVRAFTLPVLALPVCSYIIRLAVPCYDAIAFYFIPLPRVLPPLPVYMPPHSFLFFVLPDLRTFPLPRPFCRITWPILFVEHWIFCWTFLLPYLNLLHSFIYWIFPPAYYIEVHSTLKYMVLLHCWMVCISDGRACWCRTCRSVDVCRGQVPCRWYVCGRIGRYRIVSCVLFYYWRTYLPASSVHWR